MPEIPGDLDAADIDIDTWNAEHADVIAAGVPEVEADADPADVRDLDVDADA